MAKIFKTFTIELPDGGEFDLEAQANHTVNKNYGADADNRRGERRDYIEDVTISPKEMERFTKALLNSLEEADWL